MKSQIRASGAIACALALVTIPASCSKKTAAPVTVPSDSVGQEPFPGGALITSSDLTATPAVLPAAPPAYNYDPVRPNISHKEFARFAWRQFIYFNSPALKNGVTAPGKTPVVRGAIDPERNFAASGDKAFHQSGKSDGSNFSSNVLVWETFAHRSELFPANAAPKGDISNLDPTYIFQNVEVAPADARFNNLDENSQIGQNQIFFPKQGNTPSANPYDDYMILFQAKVNQAEYGYISAIYDKDKVPDSLELPPNDVGYEAESVEVKSAWREMSPELIASGRYHTAEALYYVEEKGKTQAKVGTFGLVGLHILRKMKNYPAFVYTTFEQVDSLTTPEQKETGLYLITLYDTMAYDASIPPGSRLQAIINTGPNRVQHPLPLAGAVDSANGYDIIPGSFQLPAGFAGPIKVQNPPVLTQDVYEVNMEVQQAMASTPEFKDSVWKYYRLAGIQVLPTNEDSSVTAPPNPLTQDYYLANIVIESSQPGIQLFKGGVVEPVLQGDELLFVNQRTLPNIQGVTGLPQGADTLVMGGCMGCHGNARYPRHTGPSIFNFLIDKDTTMKGTGFSADARNDGAEELRTRVLEYLHRR